MIKDNSKFQKHGTWFITWLHFLFFNLSSKPHGCPLKEADLETVKVVNFATKWLNLYPHTVQTVIPKKQHTFKRTQYHILSPIVGFSSVLAFLQAFLASILKEEYYGEPSLSWSDCLLLLSDIPVSTVHPFREEFVPLRSHQRPYLTKRSLCCLKNNL